MKEPLASSHGFVSRPNVAEHVNDERDAKQLGPTGGGASSPLNLSTPKLLMPFVVCIQVYLQVYSLHALAGCLEECAISAKLGPAIRHNRDAGDGFAGAE